MPDPRPLSLDDTSNLDLQGVALLLKADLERGLATAEAQRRKEEFGVNTPMLQRQPGWSRVLARQFVNRLTLLLIAATMISVVLGEWLNASAIGITILLSAGFGFLNEYR